MSGNLLVINVDVREIRVALIEDGIIAELHIERLSSRNTAGNIYLGKVSRVLPGMQAAFIDIGEERAAFLHVEDLIRPDDFEAYLRGEDPYAEPEEEEEPEVIEVKVPDDLGLETSDEAAAATPGDDDAADGEKPTAKPRRARRKRRARTTKTSAAASLEEPSDATAEEPSDAKPAVAESADAEASAAEPADAKPAEPADAKPARPRRKRRTTRRTASTAKPAPSPSSASAPSSEGSSSEPPPSDGGGAPPAPSSEGSNATAPKAAAKASKAATKASKAATKASKAATKASKAATKASKAATKDSGDTAEVSAAATDTADATEVEPTKVPKRVRGTRVKMARSRKKATTRTTTTETGSSSRRDNSKRGGRRTSSKRSGNSGSRRTNRGRGRNQRNRPLSKSRIPKDTPIREVVREGQEVVVQVTKDPIGSKGARVSSHMSLPGRYVVYLPTGERLGISKRIGSDSERARLRDAIDGMKPPVGGLVVRTVAAGLTKKQLKNDVGYLVRLWTEIGRAREEAQRAPALLYEELDLVLKTARDLFSEDVGRVIIDNREQYIRLHRFVEMFMPERADDIELYEGTEPVFDAYGIEDEISRALSRKVPLTSGGHLVIDQAEALTAIDVNTGRFVGKGSKDLEETILATNLEAVQEIAYQLRFRNIGGLIILDLIDMDRHANREKVRQKLATLLTNDKAKTTINRISDLGLIEMTRKRTRESLGRLLHEPCFYCDGTGQLMSRETVAYEILRQIRREQAHLKGYKIRINAHPAVIDLLKVEEREAVQEVERLFKRRIELDAKQEYHIEQFDLQGA